MTNKYTDKDDIFKETFRLVPSVQDIVTHLTFSYGFNYTRKYFINTEQRVDSNYETDYGRGYPLNLEMVWVRDRATALDVAKRMVHHRRRTQLKAVFDTSIHGFLDDLGSQIEVDHYIGPNVSDVVVTSITTDIDRLAYGIEAQVKYDAITSTSTTTTTTTTTTSSTTTTTVGPQVSIVYSRYQDGYVSLSDTPFSTVRGAGSGDTVFDDDQEVDDAVLVNEIAGDFTISRAFFDFDLSDIPSGKTIIEAKLYLCPNEDDTGDFAEVSFQESTAATTLVLASYNDFTGSNWGIIDFSGASEGIYVSGEFNAAGLTYLEGKLGTSDAKICVREYDHDYSNSAPGTGEVYDAGFYFFDSVRENSRPYLKITWNA